MQSKKLKLASVFLAASFATPVLLQAAPQDGRYYDKHHKDYHQWDDHENNAWHRYLAENHHKEYEFSKAKRAEQERYWAWRHSHPD